MDGNRAGSDPKPLIILSTLADGADIAEIFSLRNLGFNVPQKAQK